jgi:hypothetical protein
MPSPFGADISAEKTGGIIAAKYGLQGDVGMTSVFDAQRVVGWIAESPQSDHGPQLSPSFPPAFAGAVAGVTFSKVLTLNYVTPAFTKATIFKVTTLNSVTPANSDSKKYEAI